MNEMVACSESGSAFQTDGTCDCSKGHFRKSSTSCTACPSYTSQTLNGYTGTKCSNASVTTCSDAGTFNPSTDKCDCDPGIQGVICDSDKPELAEADAKNLVPFYGAAGAISVVTLFGSASYAYCYLDESKSKKLNIFWFALFVTLRIFDTMSDWSMYALTLQSDRFTLYSTYGSEGGADGLGLGINANHLQKVSLAFTIIGTLLLTLDLTTFRKRAAAWFSTSAALEEDEQKAVGTGMAAILLFEDLPQLAICIAYLKSVKFGVGDFEGDDVLAIVSLVLSILSLLSNGVLAVQNLRCF